MLSSIRRIGVLTAAFCLAACTAAPNRAAEMLPLQPIMIPPTISSEDAGSLTGRAWAWQETRFDDGRTVVPDAPERYTVEFAGDGRAALRADCNRGGANYTAGPGRALTLAPAAMTKMGCPRDSKDSQFLRQLSGVTAYRFVDGSLVLTFGREAGSMRFAPVSR